MNSEAIKAALAKVEVARSKNDLIALKSALHEAREAGAASGFVDEALREIEQVEKQAAAGGEECADAETQAMKWKDAGNAKIKEGTDRASLQAARECYSSGILLKHNNAKLISQLYGNRAHCHTLLRNFSDAVNDCEKAVCIDPSNTKAYWRAARASMLNALFLQAVQWCDRGLAIGESEDLEKIKAQCESKLSATQRKRGIANPQEAMEAETRLNRLREQCMQCAMRMQDVNQRKRTAELTMENMDTLPNDTRTFAGAGRAFLLTPQTTIRRKLETAIKEFDEELPKLTKAREELDKRREAAEHEMRELIESFQSQS